MLLFRRIFDFQKSHVPQLEQRHNQRYPAGKEFPLRARLHTAGTVWPGRILNISAGGIGLLLDRSAAPATSQPEGRLHLELDQYELELEVRLAHVESQADGWFCGLNLTFGDFTVQKTYLQLLQPISIACALQPVAAGPVAPDEPPPPQYSFRGGSSCELIVWRGNQPGAGLQRFELMMPDYSIRGDTGTRMLEVVLRPHQERTSPLEAPALVLDLSEDTKADIRQLYRWIVPNLPESLPGEIRVFLKNFAH